MPYRYAPEPFVDPPLGMAGGTPRAIGGGRPRGTRVAMRANTDPLRQPDIALRALNSEPTEPGPRDQVYCTKIGVTRPDEMYIVSATTQMMMIARLISAPGDNGDFGGNG